MRGFTLVETLIATAIFALLFFALYELGTAAVRGLRTYRDTAAVAALSQSYIEIARNLPYAQVGTKTGNPAGPLPDQANPLVIPYNNYTYQIYFSVAYIDDPADGTSAVDTDYKQVKLYIKNVTTNHQSSFVTTVVPKGLENMATGGALVLSVINAVGQPVPGATLHITNSAISPALDVMRTTDAQGKWTEVGVTSSANSYHIVATQSGYSTDQTYPSTEQNANPTKPDATVVTGQSTSVSFSIDQVSALTLKAVNQSCQPISGADIQLRGSKLIGTPNVLKFDQTVTTNASGLAILDPIEWDSYTPTPKGSYMLYGSSPLQQINLLPNTSQQTTLMLGPATTNSLLVVVTDAATGNSIEGATVQLLNSTLGYSASRLTAGSILYQEDWSGGAGQDDMSIANKYSSDDGGVDTSTLPTGLRLRVVGGAYTGSGSLISSTFDTGTASTTYSTLTWNPQSQSASTSVQFQLAANNDNATWDFVGPDGTSATYYTVPGTTISTALAHKRYVRYKVFLQSASTSTTPVISNVTINYMSGCYTPGQAMFAGLTQGGGYQVVIQMPGYLTQTINNVSLSGQQTLRIQLNP